MTEWWHSPKFAGALCGTMSDRERLGLPECFFPCRFDDIGETWRRLAGLDRAELCAIVEDRASCLADRYAAGNLLALLGDPRIDPTSPRMLDIPGGEVEIGLDQAEVDAVMERFSGLGLDRKWILKECPSHRVLLGNYRMAKYPVTNFEYRIFLEQTGHSEIPDSWAFRRYPQERSNHPVFTVSAQSADAYARWLSGQTGRRLRLPTEAEWEHAAAGPDRFEFPWGNEFLADRCNTLETGILSTTPVGMFLEGNSPFGIADMAGNVEEYVSDDYHSYPGGEFVSDHLVEKNGNYRVARGGGFARMRDLARTRRRHGHNPASKTYAMGFRLAEDC